MLIIREAVLTDLEGVEGVEGESFEVSRFERELLIRLLSGEEFQTWVAELDGETVGYASVLVGEQGPVRLISIAVVPAHREGGVARGLLERVREFAHAIGRGRVSLEVRITNVPAINLYLRSGFTIKGLLKGYYTEGREEPEDALYMILDLTG